MVKSMGLKNDVKKIFVEISGTAVAEQVEHFEDPESYPEDFCRECHHFLSQIIGESAAKERLDPICRKYLKDKQNVSQ